MRNLNFPRQQIAEEATFTVEDRLQVRQCRGSHNRLGFAYQIAFVRLTGRFPAQNPPELLENLVAFVAREIDVNPEEITRYACRQPTVSEHQEQIRIYLGIKRFGKTENDLLRRFLFEEASRLEQPSSLLSIACEFLRDHRILIPAESTLRRVIGEQRDSARQSIFEQMMKALNRETQDHLDGLLNIDGSGASTLQLLKEPPGAPSSSAILRLIDKLDQIKATGALKFDLSWLNNNFQKSLAKRARHSSVWRLRELQPSHRYAVLVCFLWQTYLDTTDHIVEMYGKLITRIWRRAENELGEHIKKQRKSLRTAMAMFKAMVLVLLDEELSDVDVRSSVFSQIPEERLREQLTAAEDWFSGGKSEPFAFVMGRFNRLRQFVPHLLDCLSFRIEPEGNNSLLRAIDILREMNRNKKRKIPDEAPMDFIPQRLRPFIEENGCVNRRAYECAVLTTLRDEIRRGNIWVKNSKRYVRLDDFFISDAKWAIMREDFFRKAGLPSQTSEVGPWLTKRLDHAFSRFLQTLPNNAYVKLEEDCWHFGTDLSEKLDLESEQRLSQLEGWLGEKIRSIKLPDLLIEVDNELQYTRHFIHPARQSERRAKDICSIIATIMAYGCNIGSQTMSRLTSNVTYDEIRRIADWHLHDDTLRRALADVVNAIIALESTHVWGEGKTSSSDGQRFLFPRKILQRTWSHRISNFAFEFYSFIADNYAPFYSIPIECTDRDAAFVLDGLLYHESDLDIEEHYVDTHGYTELNFAAFAMYNKRFCPRIRGLHHQWIYRINRDKDYGPLKPVVGRSDRTIHLDWICDQWDRMGQFYASLKIGHTTASVALKRLMSYSPKNEFYRANRELGRIFKTEFILQYLSDPAFRRRIQQGLLKGEQLHSLARNVHYGRQGKNYARDFQQQMSTASCLVLILACIVYWQAKEISQVLSKNNPEKDGIDVSLLSHISPIGWNNVLLYGQYVLNWNLVR